MMYLRHCRKCRGDMLLDQDRYGSFLVCLQCGYHHDLDPHRDALEQHASADLKVLKAA